jgi:hypothetical protein
MGNPIKDIVTYVDQNIVAMEKKDETDFIDFLQSFTIVKDVKGEQ